MGIETRVAQKEKLYSLLAIKKAFELANMEMHPEVSRQIRQAKAAMVEEDISHVEKQVESIND